MRNVVVLGLVLLGLAWCSAVQAQQIVLVLVDRQATPPVMVVPVNLPGTRSVPTLGEYSEPARLVSYAGNGYPYSPAFAPAPYGNGHSVYAQVGTGPLPQGFPPGAIPIGRPIVCGPNGCR